MQTTFSDLLKTAAPSSAAVDTRSTSLPSIFVSHVESFMSKLSDIEHRLLQPQADKESLTKETTSLLVAMSYVYEDYEREFAAFPDIIRQTQQDFRAMTDSHFLKSYFMKRARTWPQGYPGDYLTLEGVYSNTARSAGLGYCLDRHFLEATLGRAVRSRLSTLTDILGETIKKYHAPQMLNIACGSCRELVSLSEDIMNVDGRITCIDFDDDALLFSMKRLSQTRLDLEHSSFRKYNALKLINLNRNLKEFGPMDVIYSAGFFDYMGDETLAQILSSTYRLLKPGGTLIAPFKDATQYRVQEYHWNVDWNGFLQRDPDDIEAVFEKAGIPKARYRTMRDSTGVILFFVATA